MPIRYQADNDLRRHFVLAVRRREPAIHFQTAQRAFLDQLDDATVLRRAASEERVLVSHDKRTMPQALKTLLEEGLESPGIFIVIPQNVGVQQVCESLILAWAASEPWVGEIKSPKSRSERRLVRGSVMLANFVQETAPADESARRVPTQPRASVRSFRAEINRARRFSLFADSLGSR